MLVPWLWVLGECNIAGVWCMWCMKSPINSACQLAHAVACVDGCSTCSRLFWRCPYGQIQPLSDLLAHIPGAHSFTQTSQALSYYVHQQLCW